MTKRDDNAIRLAVERELGVETHSALFRLGVFCLVALLMALFLVGGSFSRNTSEGDVTASGLSLKTATFDVKVEEGGDYTSGNSYADDQVVLYAFTVTNNSEVDITYDMVFKIDISITYPGIDVINVDDLKFILIDPGNGDNIINFEVTIPTSGSITTEIDYSTTEEGTEEGGFFLVKGEATTIVLVVDYSGINFYSNDDVLITINEGSTIEFTVSQAKGGY